MALCLQPRSLGWRLRSARSFSSRPPDPASFVPTSPPMISSCLCARLSHISSEEVWGPGLSYGCGPFFRIPLLCPFAAAALAMVELLTPCAWAP